MPSATLALADRQAMAPATTNVRQANGLRRAASRRLATDRLTLCAMATLGILMLLAAAADVLAAHVFRVGLAEQDLLRAYGRPDLTRPALWLGADDLGRSQVVRLLYGGRVSLGVACGAALLNLALGVPVGLLAGYARGWVDDLVQWLVATLNGVPRLFLLVMISALFGPGPLALVLVLGLLAWPGIALFVRGQTLALREREFVVAARVLGASDLRIMARHLLPNVLSLVIVLTAIDVGGLILAESALSFLGLGIQPPIPSWGNLLTNASTTLQRAPWLVWGPGLAIFATVLCLYLVGDGLRDALDPRLRTD
jgi:peptide/nickel transport system permease protein